MCLLDCRGPLMCCIAGADFAARAVSQSVVHARRAAVGRPIVNALQRQQSVAVSRGQEGQ